MRLPVAAYLRAWADRNPGALRSMAESGNDAIDVFRALLWQELAGLPPWGVEVARATILRYDASRADLIAGVLAELQADAGEVGEVARRHPEWVTDHLRRLWNLAVAWARGDCGVPAGQPGLGRGRAAFGHPR